MITLNPIYTSDPRACFQVTWDGTPAAAAGADSATQLELLSAAEGELRLSFDAHMKYLSEVTPQHALMLGTAVICNVLRIGTMTCPSRIGNMKWTGRITRTCIFDVFFLVLLCLSPATCHL